MMQIEFDSAKNEKNIRERDLSFERVREFNFETANVTIDDRRDYGEVRYVATGYLEQRLYILCFTETTLGIRVISFRKANNREVKKYEQSTFNK